MTTPPDNAPSLGGQHTNDVKLGGDSALLHLINNLDHSDPNVRSRAALMLAGRGDIRAYDTLVRMYEEGPQFRQGVVRAFGKLKDTRATYRLVALLFDTSESRRLRITAAQALRDLNTPQAVDALLNFIEHHHNDQSVSVPVGVVKMLAELHEVRAIPILRPLLLIHVPWSGIPYNEAVRWGRGTLVVALFETLKSLEGPVLLTDLLTQARSGNHRAVRLICELGGQESVPDLLMLLRHHLGDDRQLYYSARCIAQALNWYKDPTILSSILEILASNIISDRGLIRDLLRLISSYQDERTVEIIISILPENLYSAYEVTRALYTIGGKRAIEAVRVMLTYEYGYVREQAQSALNDIHTPEAMTLITESLPYVEQLRRQQR